ncbi:MAG TPA: beta-ketoacyl synthase N-terminal-like domain-containing protein, partial [Anaerolineae bacterium]
MEHNNHHEGPARVVITGLGLISPLGHDVESTWSALINGASACRHITLFDPTTIDVKIACEVKNFDPGAHFGARDARRLDRCAQFAVVAARQALEDAKYTITDENTYDTAIVLGSGIGGVSTLTSEHAVMMQKGPNRVSPFAVPMMLPDTATGQVAIHLKVKGPNFCVVSACASGTNALGEAFELIRARRADVAISGGTEAPINAFALAAFHNMGALSTY